MNYSAIEERIPLANDQLLIDLANSIHTNQSLIAYRANRGFWGRLLDSLTGRTYQQDTLLAQNLTRGQEALLSITNELIEKLQFNEYALVTTQHSLRETRECLVATQHSLRETREGLNHNTQALNSLLNSLIETCDRKFQEQEKRIATLERRVTAREDFDRIFSLWRSGQSYHDLPWAIQILFLAREIYNSSIAYLELEQQVTYYRDLLVNEILAHQRHDLPKHFFSTATLLKVTRQATAQEDTEIVYDILASCRYSDSYPLLHNMSTLYCQQQPSFVPQHPPYTLDAKEVIQRIVHETAAATLHSLQSLKSKE
ncbi:hypothetical protein FFX45_07125 [Thermosynechococcus sp. CL-1]|uniref:diguanylate cyclase regulator RdcB family protein n=1 Tax=Thermosynechococcus sp. CL-1 TaxID=2583530 RepID=UPI00122E5BA1|nr:diguanylate cyclase regulator RdcB family protein [Thermosynechococcus sp. CL-1]QEQ01165.1 hypothetical protein FFX45_07125 [Thermosynechococcus sp. CL-1]